MDYLNDLLTDTQKLVLIYRKQGMTQQQIANIIGTSKANVSTHEKHARNNIIRATKCIEWVNENITESHL